jgi:hypothetical protein
MAKTVVGMYVWIAGFESEGANVFVGTDKVFEYFKVRPIVHRLSVDAAGVQADPPASNPKKNKFSLQGRLPSVHIYDDLDNLFDGYGINARFLSPEYTSVNAENWINTPAGQEFSKDAKWKLLVYKQFDDDPDGMLVKITGKENDEA